MEGLAFDIRQFWDACNHVAGSVVAGGTLEIESLSRANHLRDHVLTVIRTLDLELYEKSGDQAYRDLRDSDPRGHAVRAILGPRNQGVHGAEVFDSDIAQALGPDPDTGMYVIFPRWKPRSQLPQSMFEFRGTPNRGCQDAYDRAAAGRPVLDSMMDAFAFFEACDARVVNRDVDGQIPGFPLPAAPLANRYRRLHPDWPSERDWNLQTRARILDQVPGGQHRSVDGTIEFDGQILLCGFTQVSDTYRERYTEPLQQIGFDVQRGYAYYVVVDGNELRVTQVDESIHAIGGAVVDVGALPNLAGATPAWDALRELCLEDANYYRIQRQQPLRPGGAVAPKAPVPAGANTGASDDRRTPLQTAPNVQLLLLSEPSGDAFSAQERNAGEGSACS